MISTYPAPSRPAANLPIHLAPGTLVRIQNNPDSYRIDCAAAWADAAHSVPTHYNVTGPNGRLHIMVPVERMETACSAGGELDTTDGKPVPRVKHAHCWNCQTILDHRRNTVCPKCRGLLCECGGCRCNWPFSAITPHCHHFP